MNLEIETLQLELPVHETKRALRIVDLIKEALARMPPLPVVERDIRIAALVAEDVRLIPGAPDAEIASAVVASIYRALVQAINSAGSGVRSDMGPALQASGAPTAGVTPTDGTQDAPPDAMESLPRYQLSGPTLRPPRPAPGLPVPKLALISMSDLAEYDLLKGKIGDLHGRPLRTAREYLEHRRKIFGSDSGYAAEAAIADVEFEALPPRARDNIGGGTFEGEAQKLLYRWVREGYLRSGITNPSAVVQQGKTAELKQAIVNVERTQGKFPEGAFVPRPEKIAPSYLFELGTISKHSTGKAVDVDDKKNPTLSLAQWAHIETSTGKMVDRSLTRWTKHPEAFWKDIDDISTSFSKSKHQEMLKDLQKRKKNGEKNIDELITLHTKWANGFFSLDKDLVLAFHEQGLIWGATFSNQVDLHHFELP